MFTREGLLSVSDLKLAGKLDGMSDRQFEGYKEVLNAFIDSFPNIADKMRKAVDDKAYSALGKGVADVCDMLDRIYASELSRDARKQFGTIAAAGSNADQDLAEAFVEKFILNTSSLSIDIQMSARKASAAPKGVPTLFTAGQQSAPTATKGTSGAPLIFTAGSTSSSGKPLILAVDNAIMFLNTIKKLLNNTPYELHCISSCSEAIQFLQVNRPSLFLLDIEMPEMDGYELARRIKGMGHTAPIVFITANSAREYVDRAVDVGAVGLLMKPIRSHTLLAKVKEFIY
jgi:CheY-like chemotaxis protein